MTAPDEMFLAALAANEIDLPTEQVARLDAYCRLLWEWNQKLNLTRHVDHERFVARDLVDTLAFSEFVAPDEVVLDVGTGGGVPGVVLAILRPDVKVSLSENVRKRARAVADIVQRLDLSVPVHAMRAEQVLARQPFHTLTVRAVAPIEKLLGWLTDRWKSFDRLLLVSGPAWVEQRGKARHVGRMHGLALRRLKSYPLAGTDSESVVLQICPSDRLFEKDSCRLRSIEGRAIDREHRKV